MARPHRPHHQRLAQAGICRKGKTWNDLRVSSDARHFVQAHMTEQAFELFLRSHWSQVPQTMREGAAMKSVLRSQGIAYLVAETFCDRGIVKGLVRTADETGDR